MLEELLGELNNWFVRDIAEGDFSISDGVLSVPGGLLREGQYLRIVGSVFNDGLHQWPATGLADEEFHGAGWAVAVPREVQDLAEEIAAWASSEAGKAGPYVSESFGGYSYTKATNPSTGTAVQWQDVYRDRMNRWRKVPGCW